VKRFPDAAYNTLQGMYAFKPTFGTLKCHNFPQVRAERLDGSYQALAALKLLNQFIEEPGVVAVSLKSVPYTNAWY